MAGWRLFLGGLALAGLMAGAGCTSDREPAGGSSSAGSSVSPPARSSAPVRSSAPAPATVPVAPPEPGTVTETAKSRPVVKRKPVPLDDQGQVSDDVTVRLRDIKAVRATATGPGEVAGPAVAVTVEVTNASTADLDLSRAVVNLVDSAGNPGSTMTAAPAKPLPQGVSAGKSASGVFVFTVSTKRRNPITVEVDLAPPLPTVVFKGKS